MSHANRVIVLGAGGQLGRQIVARLQDASEWEVVALDRQRLDITDPDAVRESVVSQRAAWLINAAGMTHVDRCETETSQASAVNAEAVAHLASSCSKAGTTLVYLSTDYVFDGRSSRPYVEDDPPHPINAYGRSKWLGEQNARTARRHLILRTAWLYGPGGRNFVDTILHKAAAGTALRVIHDQFGSPSYAPDMADCIARLMRLDAEGVFHIANAGTVTWYELACKATELAHLRVPVEPVTSEMYPTPARRPAFSVLNCRKYTASTGHHPRQWSLALKDYIRHRSAS